MNRQFIGSVFLIAGTSVGAGMLALPLVSASEGFLAAVTLLFCSWCAMTLGAFLILEANLWFPMGSNFISMTKSTLGYAGQIITWIVCLLLLYSLLCAYISSISDVFHAFLLKINLNMKPWVNSLIIILIFGSIVWNGMRTIDMANRFFAIIKFVAYGFLVFAILPRVNISKLLIGSSSFQVSTITVMITSFGFATIIPSLRVYLKGDIVKLRLAILIGSLIPLLLYAVWIAVVHGVVPREGANGLLHVAASGQATSELARVLSLQSTNLSFTTFVHAFIDVCAATSFLGASLCLSDFISDGLQVRKKGKGNVIVYGCTFIPPFIIVLFAPGMFIQALAYAGLFCIVLLILIPVLVVWSGRYYRGFNRGSQYQVWGGKGFLILGILFSVGLLVWNILSYF